MNFANVKAMTIPEGNVKQIVDGQGIVIWKVQSGLSSMVKINVTGKGSTATQIISSSTSDMPNSSFNAFESIYYLNSNNEKVFVWQYGNTTYPRTIVFGDTNTHDVYFELRDFNFSSMTSNIIGVAKGVPKWCFYGLTINSIEWSDDVIVFGDSAFRNSTITGGLPKLPTNIQYIGSDCFAITTSVKTPNFIFSSQLKYLGKYIVQAMTSASRPNYVYFEGNIPNTGVDSWFNSYATFNNYYGSLVFGPNVTKMRDYIYSQLRGALYFESITPPALPTNKGTNYVTHIYVPTGCLSAYVSAFSGTFSSSIISEGSI